MELASFNTEWEICPYLHDRASRQRVRLVDRVSDEDYSRLLAEGWRRFGRIVFRPACGSCQECVPIRVLVDRFRPTKSQRRVLRRNADVRVELGDPKVDGARLDLYHRFHAERSRSRGWPIREIDLEEYAFTFVDNAARTIEFSYWIGERLIGVAYVGEAKDALNSIYAFTEPELSQRSLGTFDVLSEIDIARERGLRYLYLGFWVKCCASMEYKAAYRPHQLLRSDGWHFVP